MVINGTSDDQFNHTIRFINYTGRYPNLCKGKLILEIDGVLCKFGDSFTDESLLPQFWKSGGMIISGGLQSWGVWIIDADKLPKEFKPLAHEIDVVFNAVIPYGCCGGCKDRKDG